MTRISSLFAAAALAVLPISAFAQQTATPGKTTESTTPTSTNATAPASTKTATTTQPAKPDAKAKAPGARTEVHGMNNATVPHHPGTSAPTKTTEPTKS